MVSIVIPSYNSEKFIENTIKSILAQTYKDFTLTIVDDKSTDTTFEIVKSFKDERINIIKNEVNLGLVKNWNKCLDIGKKSEYMLIICNDDIIEKNYLEKKVLAFNEDREVVLVCNATKIINEKGKKLFSRNNIKEEKLESKDVLTYSLKKGNIFGEPSCVMLKSEIIDKVGYFREELKLTLDWEYYNRFSTKGKVVFLKDELSSFRISNSSASSELIRKRKRMKEEHNIVSNEILKLLEKKESNFNILKRNIFFEIRYLAKILIFKFESLL